MPSTHRSKVDGWLVAVILGGYAIGIAASVLLMSRGGTIHLLLGAVVLVMVLLPAPFLYPVRYVVTARELVARSGILRWRVPLAAIEQVAPTRNPLAGPALSLDRLEVRFRTPYGPGFVRISPEDKGAFLQALEAADPGLRRADDRLVRG